MSLLNVAISYTLWVEWYYLKNNYLTLRSKVKVPQRSLRYATHHLMVMHPHTKYHFDLSGKTKKLWSGQASLRRSGRRGKRRSRRSGRKNQTKTICLPSFEGETNYLLSYQQKLNMVIKFLTNIKIHLYFDFCQILYHRFISIL